MLLSILLILTASPSQEANVRLVNEQQKGGFQAEFSVQDSADGSQVRDGKFTLLGPEREPLVTGKFKSDRRVGTWRFRDLGGELLARGSYRRGSRNGKWKIFGAAGSQAAEGEFVDGYPRGEWTFYDAGGGRMPVHSGDYGIIESKYDNGNVERRSCTLDQKLHGPSTIYWRNGNRQLEAFYERGTPVGSWRFWHVDGTLDPRLLSGEHPIPSYPAGLFQEPYGARIAKEKISEDSGPVPLGQQPLDLKKLQELGFVALEDRGTEAIKGASVEHLVSLLDAKSDSVRATQGLVLVTLKKLRNLDYGQAESIGLANQILGQVLIPLLGGHPLLEGDAPFTADQLKLAVLRAHSLFLFTQDAFAWWDWDLGHGAHAEEQGPCVLFSSDLYSIYHGGQAESGGVYASRFKLPRVLAPQGGEGTQPALHAGLEWLAGEQMPDGSWESLGHRHDVGVTGLVLLALMGDGNLLRVGRYQAEVRAGLGFLLDSQDKASGRIARSYRAIHPTTGNEVHYLDQRNLYDHAVATEALCEAAALEPGITHRRAAQKALEFIQAARNPYGAWKYAMVPTGESDASVTCWMVSALAAGQRAGLAVDQVAMDDALIWLNDMTGSSTGRVGYDSEGGPSSRYAGINDSFPREQGESLTAAALWSRFLLGERPGDPRFEDLMPMLRGANLLRRILPDYNFSTGHSNDMCYWFFGTYAMHAMGGDSWRRWNAATKDSILKSQVIAGEFVGSWDPSGPWGVWVGRGYSTAMMALCLEVYSRY